MTRIIEHIAPFSFPSMPSKSGRELEARLRGTEANPLWWPAEPNLFETVFDYTEPYVVTVGFVRPRPGDVPVPVEVTIRRTFPVSDEPYRPPSFAEGTEPAPFSARDVRRLPLDRIVRAATAVADHGPLDPASEVPKVLLPRGRPTGGERSIKFYKEVADAYRQIQFAQPDKSPAREIARRKRVPENTVHQWIYKARDKGFLERPPRSRKVGGRG